MKARKENGSPPGLILRFFQWYCDPKMQDYIEGDLLEVYRQRLDKSGKRRADLLFIIDVLLLFRPGIIRPSNGQNELNHYGMFKNYFKITWRTLIKQKTYSFIKIGGFSIGVAACLLIAMFVRDELSYDLHYANHKQLYRVLGVITENGDVKKGSCFSCADGQCIKR